MENRQELPQEKIIQQESRSVNPICPQSSKIYVMYTMKFFDMLYHVSFAFPSIAALAITSWLSAYKWRDVIILDMKFEILVVLKPVHTNSVTFFLWTDVCR